MGCVRGIPVKAFKAERDYNGQVAGTLVTASVGAVR